MRHDLKESNTPSNEHVDKHVSQTLQAHDLRDLGSSSSIAGAFGYLATPTTTASVIVTHAETTTIALLVQPIGLLCRGEQVQELPGLMGLGIRIIGLGFRGLVGFRILGLGCSRGRLGCHGFEDKP